MSDPKDYLGAGPPSHRSVHSSRHGLTEWRSYKDRASDQPFLRCGYCGSITPAEALRRLTTPGCRFSCTDKGAYKFYLEGEPGTGGVRESTQTKQGPDGVPVTVVLDRHVYERDYGKFYGEHLADLTFDELETWAEASRRVLGYDFIWQALGEQPLVKRYSSGQTYGVIGPDGLPVFHKDSGLPATKEQWDALPKDMMREALRLKGPV